MKKLTCVFLMLILTVLFCSCSFDESVNSFRGGELLDNERMSEIKSSFVTESSEEDEESETVSEKATEKPTDKNDGKTTEPEIETYTDGETEAIAETEIESESKDSELNTFAEQQSEIQSETFVSDQQNETVYWTKSGSVWHTDDQCYHIKKSSNVESGSVEDAMEAGKKKVCSSCGK